jgi:regulator of protease activity HflC (stomatin/prohibitin superfamily)
VPAYRDVAAAISDAARFQNEAKGYAAEQSWVGKAEAQSRRDAAATESTRLSSRAKGDRAAFLAQQAPHADRPDLTDFRLLYDALGASLAGRPKVLLDPRLAGRRQLWLADPERFGLGRAAVLQPAIPSGGERPED